MKKLKEAQNVLKIILFVVFLGTIYRYFYAFFNIQLSVTDFNLYHESGATLLTGKNPYSYGIFEQNYPPGHFYWNALIIIVFGSSETGFKLVVYLFLIFSSIFVFKIAKKIIILVENKDSNSINKKYIQSNKKAPFQIKYSKEFHEFLPWAILLLFLNDYATFTRITLGYNDIFPIFFLLFGFDAYLDEKIWISAISWAISFQLKLIPLFFFPSLFLYFFFHKDFRKLIIYCSLIFLSSLILMGPFLLEDFEGTINGFLTLFRRPNFNIGYIKEAFFPNLYRILYLQFIDVFGYSISVWAIIQICTFGFLVFIISIKKIELKPSNFLILITFFLFALPILTNCVGYRYYFWASAFFFIYVIYSKRWFLLVFYYLLRISGLYVEKSITGISVLLYIILSIAFLILISRELELES